MNIIANIISILHFCLVLFVIITPFLTDDVAFLLLYCVTLFCIIIHWYLNNNMCFLTKLECYLRGTKESKSFIGQLVKPVYDISSSEIHTITTLLFLYGLYKLRLWDKKRFNELKLKITDSYNKLSKLIYV
jgi:hypothetical protein